MFRSFNSLFLIVGIFGCTTTSVRQHTLPVNDDFSVWKLSLDQSQPEDVEKKLNSLLEEQRRPGAQDSQLEDAGRDLEGAGVGAVGVRV